jgi:hypothetical protein
LLVVVLDLEVAVLVAVQVVIVHQVLGQVHFKVVHKN